jgi:TonB family protein
MKISVSIGLAILFGISVLGVNAQETAKERVINGGVLNGKATSLPKPDYPTVARELGKGGAVSVDVVIDESGMVVSASGSSAIKTRAGADGMMAEKEEVDPSLIEAAENAAKMARFSPTFLSGVPVKIRGTIVYNFVPSKEVGDVNQNTGELLNGKAVSLPLPRYPSAAKAVGAEGAVNVSIKVNEAGEVVEAEAVSGHPLLRSAAVTAAREAKFQPTLRDGQPVQITGILVYNFVGPGKKDQ